MWTHKQGFNSQNFRSCLTHGTCVPNSWNSIEELTLRRFKLNLVLSYHIFLKLNFNKSGSLNIEYVKNNMIERILCINCVILG